MKKYKYLIGIDPGTKTGLALWDVATKDLLCSTMPIHKAMEAVLQRCEWDILNANEYLIRVEDARKRTWFGKAGKERLKGAGSVERDCAIWEGFLKDLGVDYQMVHPKNNRTKVDTETFRKITGYAGKISEHARDAAMLVYGHNGRVASLEAQK